MGGWGGWGGWVVYALIIIPLRGPSCKLRFERISVRLKFQDGPSVAILKLVLAGILAADMNEHSNIIISTVKLYGNQSKQKKIILLKISSCVEHLRMCVKSLKNGFADICTDNFRVYFGHS